MRAHHVPSSKFQALLVQIKYQQQALDESDTRLVLVPGFRWAQMSIKQIQTEVHDVHGANTTDVHGGKLQTLNMRMPFCLRLLLLLLDALTGIESFRHSALTPLSSWQCASMSVDEER